MRGIRYIGFAAVAVLAGIILPLVFIDCNAENPAEEGFAVYLIDASGSPDEAPDIDDVVIGDTPFIGPDDVICYDAGTHQLVLTDAAFARYQDTEGAFAVCVDRRPVYTGVFWNWFSSVSLDRIVALEQLSAEDRNIVVIQAGYPDAGFYHGTDPRNDESIVNSLREAGKLIEISASDEKIPTPFKGWDLYSFERDGKWHYTLIFGTNRTKWLDEIIFEDGATDEAEVYHRTGTGAIISLLGRLADDAHVYWGAGTNFNTPPDSGITFAAPPGNVIDAVMYYAGEFGLDLYVGQAR